jgi:hypothetical protein
MQYFRNEEEDDDCDIRLCQLTCGVLHAPMSKMDGASTKKQKIADDIGIEPMAFRLTVKRSTN